TERNIYALDYNCHPGRALASGLYRPLWRRSDPSSARDCRHRTRYSAASRQTRALSESVFAPAVSVVHPHNRFCTPKTTLLYAVLVCAAPALSWAAWIMREPLLPNSRRDRSHPFPSLAKGPAIENGRNWVLLPFQLIYWQPGSRTRAIPSLEQPKGGNENAEDTKKNQEQEAARQSREFEALEGGEG